MKRSAPRPAYDRTGSEPKPKRKKRTYEVRVTRTYAEEWVDLEVEACTREEAIKKAKAEVKRDSNMLFGDAGKPEYDAEVND